MKHRLIPPLEPEGDADRRQCGVGGGIRIQRIYTEIRPFVDQTSILDPQSHVLNQPDVGPAALISFRSEDRC